MTIVNDANTRLFHNRDHHAQAKKEMANDYQRSLDRQKQSYENRIGKMKQNNDEDRSELETGYEVKISDLNRNQADELKGLKQNFLSDKNSTEEKHQNSLQQRDQDHDQFLDKAKKDYTLERDSETSRLSDANRKASANYQSHLAKFQDQAARKERSLTDQYSKGLYDQQKMMQEKVSNNAADYQQRFANLNHQVADQAAKQRVESSEENQYVQNKLLEQQQRAENDFNRKLFAQDMTSANTTENLTAKSNDRLNKMQNVFVEEKKGIIEYSKKQMAQNAEMVKEDYSRRFDTLNEDFSKRLVQQEMENKSLREQFRTKLEAMERSSVQQQQQYQVMTDRQMELERNALQEKLKSELKLHDDVLNKERTLHRAEAARIKEEGDRRIGEVAHRYEELLKTRKADHDSEMQKAQIAYNQRLDKAVNESKRVQEDLVSVYEDRLDSMRDKLSSNSKAMG